MTEGKLFPYQRDAILKMMSIPSSYFKARPKMGSASEVALHDNKPYFDSVIEPIRKKVSKYMDDYVYALGYLLIMQDLKKKQEKRRKKRLIVLMSVLATVTIIWGILR